MGDIFADSADQVKIALLVVFKNKYSDLQGLLISMMIYQDLHFSIVLQTI